MKYKITSLPLLNIDNNYMYVKAITIVLLTMGQGDGVPETCKCTVFPLM